ncbi:monovalent cation:proton antiporter-2 (CPA2) family protein [Aquabacter spiritensis]|uniref:Kef-type potassium/proton antiporter (CPA2 family) n=1 Tax=Aquabacter spiritensis TaxID=933073 RepID=A0A4R3LXK8_9HYPH|nr:monovalent cation:proton antiporter-2 (CPA2) family protein [Aquabacter spiritensis]TCT03465.1 Kef-type potassium/proton antiporter (CPA2 family) [Aquabacter spiritensis]
MHGDDHTLFISGLAFLAAAVISVPLAKRFGLSPVVGYLLAGIMIGPAGFSVADPATVITVAELGVVLLLFLIGLELQPSRLLSMGRYIFGLGTAQLLITGTVIAGVAWSLGLGLPGAIIAGMALAMSATSIALQLLSERGDLSSGYGQRAFSILLFQDIAIVPLLALVPLLAPGASDAAHDLTATMIQAGAAIAAVAGIVLAGRYLLNPLFRLLARSGAREAMTAAALLVVLGSAGLMAMVGLSMALGAFLAGLLLSESTFRHELEANIDAFRGLLLAVFFMGIGMSLDLGVLLPHIVPLVLAAVLITAIKFGVVFALYRTDHTTRSDALRAGAVLMPAGEFAFVLFPLALANGLLTPEQGGFLTATAAITMMIGPLVSAGINTLLPRLKRNEPEPEPDDFSDAGGRVLVIGFGRFGQIVSQCLLAEGVGVTIIDNDVEMIQSAGRFGVHIYYGDGTRLEVLRAAGAETAEVIAVCVDDREAADRIVAIVQASMPHVRLHVRSFDRAHSMDLLRKGVDFEMRETLESAFAFGGHTLEALGLEAEAVAELVADVRERDRRRLQRQVEEGLYAGIDLIPTRKVEPEPLTEPGRPAKPLNPEAQDVLTHETEFSG